MVEVRFEAITRLARCRIVTFDCWSSGSASSNLVVLYHKVLTSLYAAKLQLMGTWLALTCPYCRLFTYGKGDEKGSRRRRKRLGGAVASGQRNAYRRQLDG
jgi:hypothetical protein